MRRIGLSLLVLAGLAGAAGGGPVEDRRAYRDLLETVEVRHGLHHRSMALVPLVLKEGIEPAPVPGFARAGLAWNPVGDPTRADTVSITGRPETPTLLPAGLLLSGDGRERILSRPILVPPGKPVLVRAVFCDAVAGPPGDPPPGPHRVGPIAAMGPRRTDLLYRDEAALADLQRIHGILAGLPADARTFEEVLRAPGLAARMAAAEKAFTPLAGAYDGATAGHLVFLGHRPVALVLAATPAAYRSLAPDLRRALAVSLTIWEEYLGRPGLVVPPPDWSKLLGVARKTFAAAAADEVRLRKWRLGRREKAGGRTLLVLGPEPHRVHDDRSRLVGRLLLDDAGRALLLEAYPSGADRPFPSPLLGPGERPSDSRPDIRSGALTKEFLMRLLKRKSAISGGAR